MLQFLNPSLLTGLLAATIPLIIHFLNRQKIKKQPFSTVHFLKQLEPKQIRRLQFRQWLLLIIRTFLIIFLVLAFARPTIRQGALAGIGERTAVATAVILDNSQSLDESTLTGSLHEAFRQQFLNLGNLFQGNDWVTVIQATQPIKTLLKGESFNRNRWVTLQKELRPSVLRSNLYDALNLAVARLENQPQLRKEVYVLSDFQKFAEFSPQDVVKNITNPEQWRFFFIPFHHYSSENLSIDSVEIVNRLVERNQPLRIRARIRNHSKSQTLTSLVAFILNGKRVGQRNISFPPGESQWVEFETMLLDAGWITGQIELESDVLLSDNIRYFAFYTPAKITILHVKPGALKSILPLVLTPALETGHFEYRAVAPDQFLSLPPQPNSVLVLDQITDYSTVFLEGVQRFLKVGSGVIVIPPAEAPGNVNTLFRRFRLGQFMGVWGDPKNHQQFKRIQALRLSHPLFEGLFEKKSARFNPIDVYAGIRWKPSAQSSVPITFSDGTPFVSLTPVENGIIAILATPLSPAYSELPFRGFVVPFVYRLIFYSATARHNIKKSLRTGETWSRTYVQLKAPLQFSIWTPSGKTIKLQPQFRQEQIVLTFRETEESGIYIIQKGNQLLGKFVVNPWPQESDFTPMNVEEWAKSFPNGIILDANKDLKAQIAVLRSGREIWKGFLLIALFLALVEMILAWTKRRSEAESEMEPIPG